MSLMFASGNAGASQTELTFHCSYSAKVSKAVFLFFSLSFLQPAESRSPPTRRRREGSLMVTKLFIKSPVPGIDGEWGEVNKGGRSRQRHRVVMSPESCINRHIR